MVTFDVHSLQAIHDAPSIDLNQPSEQSLLAEAAALGDRFSEVTAHPADLIADAEEMLRAESDLPDLLERGYAVSAGLFTRVRLLQEMLTPLSAEGGRVETLSQAQTQAAEAARKELLGIRRELARIGRAARLPSSLFSLETRRTTRLNVVMMKMSEVLANVAAVRQVLPDKSRVDTLVTRAGELMDEQKEARRQSRFMRAERTRTVDQRNRLSRLLFDAMSYLSAQGFAAYPDDAAREPLYRLDHVYGRRFDALGHDGWCATLGDAIVELRPCHQPTF